MGKCSTCGNDTKTYDIGIGDEFILSFCEDCLADMYDTIHNECIVEENSEENPNNNNSFNIKTPIEIKRELDDYVIGQEEAKKTIAVGIYNHYKRIVSGKTNIQKSNILIVGPTGVGKTELARTCAKIVNVPFCICDATTVTEAGYVGDDVENMLLRLLQAADMDIEAAEKGIIYIDEIDKIARKSESMSITRDVSGEGVQQALLKIIEGAEVDVAITGGRKHPQGDRVRIDTSNILFICGGAFEGLTMTKEKKKELGFMSNNSIKDTEEIDITPKSLEKQGLIPELVGRLPITVKLDKLSKKELKQILTDTKNSLIKQYTDLIELDGVKFKVNQKALDFIAEQAYENETGARGLKTIIEKTMNDAMFEIPSDTNLSSVELSVNKLNKLYVKKFYKKAV